MNKDMAYQTLTLLVVLVVGMVLGKWLVTTGLLTKENTLYCPEIKCDINSDELRDLLADSIYKPLHTNVEYWYSKGQKMLTIKGVEYMSQYAGQGNSLEPYVFHGNHVIIKEWDGITLDDGMIIGYKNKLGGIVFHRVDAVYRRGKDITAVVTTKRGNNDFVIIDDIKYVVVGVLWT